MRLAKYKHCFLLGAIIAFFTLIYFPLITEFSFGSPWSDQWFHIATAEFLKINHSTNYSAVSQYHYAVLYHAILATVSTITGIEIIDVAEFLNFFAPLLFGLVVYGLAVKFFKKKWIGIFSATLILVILIASHTLINPRQLCDFFFLVSILYIYNLYTTDRKFSSLYYMIFPILVILMFMSHIGSFVNHLAIIFVVISGLYLAFLHFDYKPEVKTLAKKKTQKLLLLLIGVIGFISILATYKYEQTFPYIRVALLTSAEELPTLDMLKNIGGFAMIFSLIGIFYMKQNTDKMNLGAIILFLWFFGTMGLSFMPIGVWFRREMYVLVYPLSIIAAYGIVQVISSLSESYEFKKKNLAAILLVVLILFSTISIFRLRNERNDVFTDSVIWAKNNLENGKVIGYHRMLWGFQTIFARDGIDPALYMGRKEGGKCIGRNIEMLENDPLYVEIMENGNSTMAMKRENIRYVITTVRENYRRFMNDNFEKIYDVKWPGIENRHIRIFELKGVRLGR